MQLYIDKRFRLLFSNMNFLFDGYKVQVQITYTGLYIVTIVISGCRRVVSSCSSSQHFIQIHDVINILHRYMFNITLQIQILYDCKLQYCWRNIKIKMEEISKEETDSSTIPMTFRHSSVRSSISSFRHFKTDGSFGSFINHECYFDHDQ